MGKKLPTINTWYQDVRENVLFEVVALDDDEGFIEIQYANGEIGEFDHDTWQQMLTLPAQHPDDWRAPFELSNDDSQDPDSAFTMKPVDDPVRDIEPDPAFTTEDY